MSQTLNSSSPPHQSSSSSENDSDAIDSPQHDVWSPSLRETVFSDHEHGMWSNEARQDQGLASMPLGNDFHTMQQRVSTASRQPGSQRSNMGWSSSTRLPSFSSLHRDLSTANLRTLPIARPHSKGNNPNPHPLSGTLDHLNLPGILSRPLSPPSFHSANGRNRSNVVNAESSQESLCENQTAGSNTPYTEFDDFVDLTSESPIMSPNRNQRPPFRSHPTQEEASTISRPSKRQKISKDLPAVKKVEEIDLRDVDDDKGLSKVLEQQRLATIKAQQEQADRPNKLSTLQCVICMDSMTDVTATICGK